jgi:phosphatidylglycerophosphatase A
MTISKADPFRNPIQFLAFGFGSGLSPKAPGTMGTLVAVPLYWLISGLSLPWYSLPLLRKLLNCIT